MKKPAAPTTPAPDGAKAEREKPEPEKPEPEKPELERVEQDGAEPEKIELEKVEIERIDAVTGDVEAPAIETAASVASTWAKRVASASNSRVAELRKSLAAARASRASQISQTAALAELAKTGENPDVETSSVATPPLEAPSSETPAVETPADETTSVETSAVGSRSIKTIDIETRVEASTGPNAHDVVLSVTGLTKRFDDTVAVAGIDLTVRAGDFYGIVGPNGAGKTTTLSMITGLLRPDAGTVIVHGSDVWGDPLAAKRNMGVLPDRLRLFDRLTGSQLLYYAGVLRGLDAAVVRKRSTDLARAFGLEDSMGRLVSDYSAGMTKKIALAAAMIHSPRMLVLDEPFESVDPVSVATVTDILKNYAAAGGTVVLSSHSMDMVQRVCDHVAVVVKGEILADGTVDEVRDGKPLEVRFVELTGGLPAAEGLQWLHSFSN